MSAMSSPVKISDFIVRHTHTHTEREKSDRDISSSVRFHLFELWEVSQQRPGLSSAPQSTREGFRQESHMEDIMISKGMVKVLSFLC